MNSRRISPNGPKKSSVATTMAGQPITVSLGGGPGSAGSKKGLPGDRLLSSSNSSNSLLATTPESSQKSSLVSTDVFSEAVSTTNE